jgi:hypothetical protein
MARLAVLLLLLAPALAAWGVLAWFTLRHQQRPVHTGDVMLDACLQALVDNNMISDSRDAWSYLTGMERSGTVSRPKLDQTWRELEQRYGGDVHFWMLCYNLQWPPQAADPDSGGKYISAVAGVQLADRVWFLEQARARHCADWRVLLALVRSYEYAWTAEARSSLQLAYPGNKASTTQHYEYFHATAREIQRKHGALRDKLKRELLQAGAGQAQVHYQLAIMACIDGDLDEALAQVRAGNAAPENATGTGAPLEQLWAEAEQGRALGGDGVLSGYLTLTGTIVELPSYILYRYGIRYMAYKAARRKDAAALSVLYRASCRLGSAQNTDKIQQMVAVVIQASVLKEYKDATPQLPAPVAQRLASATVERAKLKDAVRQAPMIDIFPMLPFSARQAELELSELASDGRLYMLRLLDHYCTSGQAEQAALGKTRQRFIALEKLDPWGAP